MMVSSPARMGWAARVEVGEALPGGRVEVGHRTFEVRLDDGVGILLRERGQAGQRRLTPPELVLPVLELTDPLPQSGHFGRMGQCIRMRL